VSESLIIILFELYGKLTHVVRLKLSFIKVINPKSVAHIHSIKQEEGYVKLYMPRYYPLTEDGPFSAKGDKRNKKCIALQIDRLVLEGFNGTFQRPRSWNIEYNGVWSEEDGV
jgi:hypothetical protein